jgi:hypothetical protein
MERETAAWLAPGPPALCLARYVFAFHDRDEVFPERLALLAKQTGLTPEDL